MKELQAGTDQRRMFDEIAALTAIRSKHVVQIFDVIRDNNGLIVGLVEEFLPGSDLEALIPISNATDFLRVAYAISCGISDIHAAGRVHRDIKPNNIKFDAEGCLKIFDFGLARTNRHNAATQGAVGTPGFMAPELWVADGELVEFDGAIDVYAFGATMLQVALGSLPRPLRQFPPCLPNGEADFRALSLNLTSDVAEVMTGCFEQRPDDRPPIADIRDAIGAQLLRDRHRATFVVHGNVHTLDARQRGVVITLPGGVARFRYDGLAFSIKLVSGDVFVNNIKVTSQTILPRSCVVSFGSPTLGMNRVHVPIDVSHPEVVL